MTIKSTVKDILQEKGPEVITISDQKSVYEAMSLLMDRRIGSLLALDDGAKISGIITERDILRESHRNFENLKNVRVQDVMTKKLIIGEPEDEIDYVENIMTTNRIRHLPIISNKRLIGMVSIGDIVKSQLKGVQVENRYLKDFIEGRYPA